jgi:predicted transcriptional regulator with HTH domain
MGESGVNPSALTVDEAAALMRSDASTVRRHVEEGLPVDGQGRIHLIEYMAWIIQRLNGMK